VLSAANIFTVSACLVFELRDINVPRTLTTVDGKFVKVLMMILLMTSERARCVIVSVWWAGGCQDLQFQRYLHYIDQLGPHSESGCGGGDAGIEMIAQQRLSRINRDIQQRVKLAQDDETAFRLSYQLSLYYSMLYIPLAVCAH